MERVKVFGYDGRVCIIERASFFYVVLGTESQLEIRKAKESYARAKGKDSRCECHLMLHI